MATLLEMRAQVGTQSPLIYHKMPTLQINLKTEVLVLKKKTYRLTCFILKENQITPMPYVRHHWTRVFLKHIRM